MSFVRNLLSDLVARRLWPVALVLLAALVAVPVLLSGDVKAPPAPVASSEPSTGTSPMVSVASDEPIGGRTPIGRNPFRQKDVAPPAETSTGVTVSGGSTSGGPGSGSGSGFGAGAGLDVTGGLPALDDVDLIPVGGGGPAVPKTDARDSYRVDIRFGRDGSLSSRSNVPRLSPLPSAADPFFVFMGVLADGETALFLVSSDAEATGDGSCKPSPVNCERVEMQAGETEFFDVTTPEGTVVQYQLDLVRVARVRAGSPTAAASARSRESIEGREVLRRAIDTKQVDVANIAYSRDLGVLIPSAAAGAEDDALFGGFRTDLQFGRPGELVKRYNLARLTPLPSTQAPAFLYLGVMGDDDDPKALFLNPSGAAVAGDAVCNPTPDDCTRVELRPGQSGLLDVPTLDGQTAEYQLDIDAITKLEAETPAEAKRMLERESPAGRLVLRRLITEVGGLVSDISYSSSKGKLVPASG